MVCFNFLILIPLITAARQLDRPSYRSNIMDGDKPILRMSPNADNGESNSDEGRQTMPPFKTKYPTLVRDLGLLVKWLMENFSYDVVPQGRKNYNDGKETGKPILRMPLTDTVESDADSDQDDDEVTPKIDTTEALPLTKNPVTPRVEASVESSVENENTDGALRTKHNKKKPEEEEPKPEWVKDLKEFIKDLTTHYGQQEVLERAKPVIATLEKKHNMKIKDIDVDEYGEIHITYIEKGKGKKTARNRKKPDKT